jgi:polysaccharide deacetylase 2 family uncharacterized protein YibQ
MNKISRIILLIVLALTPLVFYTLFNKKIGVKRDFARGAKQAVSFNVTVGNATAINASESPVPSFRPKIAIIFDDLGENLNDIREISSLKIPITISVIPGLRFSRNIAQIAFRCGFDILLHIPMEPEKGEKYRTDKYKFISAASSKQENMSLLHYYLGYLKIAVGVNNHMGSKATQDRKLMELVLGEVKKKNLFFIDSRTSSQSVACDVARDKNVACGKNEGFIDISPREGDIIKHLIHFIEIAKTKEKIILIVHPKKNTFKALSEKIPELKNEVDFITVKEYLKNNANDR